MNTIIEKIRAEIERRIATEELYLTANNVNNQERREWILRDKELLAKLSDLEKEEKPNEGLEEEIERYLHSLGVGYGGWVDGMEDDDLRGIARHFAQWGAEHRGSSETPKDLDESTIAKIVMGVITLADGESIETMRNYSYGDLVIAGANWQREQMMKEAVEGSVGRNFTGMQEISFTVYPDKYKDGDKVRIIIVKEDGK